MRCLPTRAIILFNVLAFDVEGHLVGIGIDHASQIVNLSRLEAEALSF